MGEPSKTPGGVIKSLRESKGMSGYALSRAAGISLEGIRQIETKGGWRVSIESFKRICQALGAKPGEVLDQIGDIEGAGPPAITRGRGRPKKEMAK